MLYVTLAPHKRIYIYKSGVFVPTVKMRGLVRGTVAFYDGGAGGDDDDGGEVVWRTKNR